VQTRLNLSGGGLQRRASHPGSDDAARAALLELIDGKGEDAVEAA